MSLIHIYVYVHTYLFSWFSFSKSYLGYYRPSRNFDLLVIHSIYTFWLGHWLYGVPAFCGRSWRQSPTAQVPLHKDYYMLCEFQMSHWTHLKHLLRICFHLHIQCISYTVSEDFVTRIVMCFGKTSGALGPCCWISGTQNLSGYIHDLDTQYNSIHRSFHSNVSLLIHIYPSISTFKYMLHYQFFILHLKYSWLVSDCVCQEF